MYSSAPRFQNENFSTEEKAFVSDVNQEKEKLQLKKKRREILDSCGGEKSGSERRRRRRRRRSRAAAEEEEEEEKKPKNEKETRKPFQKSKKEIRQLIRASMEIRARKEGESMRVEDEKEANVLEITQLFTAWKNKKQVETRYLHLSYMRSGVCDFQILIDLKAAVQAKGITLMDLLRIFSGNGIIRKKEGNDLRFPFSMRWATLHQKPWYQSMITLKSEIRPDYVVCVIDK